MQLEMYYLLSAFITLSKSQLLLPVQNEMRNVTRSDKLTSKERVLLPFLWPVPCLGNWWEAWLSGTHICEEQFSAFMFGRVVKKERKISGRANIIFCFFIAEYTIKKSFFSEWSTLPGSNLTPKLGGNFPIGQLRCRFITHATAGSVGLCQKVTSIDIIDKVHFVFICDQKKYDLIIPPPKL